MENKMTETGKMTEGLFRFIDNSPPHSMPFPMRQRCLKRRDTPGLQGRSSRSETRRKILYGKKWLGIDRLPDSGRGDKGIRIVASHSDSPCFKVKETPRNGCGRALCEAECGRLWRYDYVYLAGQASVHSGAGCCEGRR